MSDCWIVTASCRKFDLLEPAEEDILIEDICTSLSKLCRFTGHCQRPYSVAQHCCIGALFVPAEYRLEFLLHDASEAYLGDVSSPLKKVLPDYKKIEDNLDRVIRRKFGLPESKTDVVHKMDRIMLATEARDLMPLCDFGEYVEGVEPLKSKITPISYFRAASNLYNAIESQLLRRSLKGTVPTSEVAAPSPVSQELFSKDFPASLIVKADFIKPS